ncbi:MAG: molybdopterin molybdotransferase MoeA, partial [Bacteroidetes bacterium]|nr:molybdopterin molybdotransferase MoeA [Bacteroidota bacterium]
MMVTVGEAENIILSQVRDYGSETVILNRCIGRVLAENILADRDMPPYNRVTMDGIAIQYQNIANRIIAYKIKGTQAAGEDPINISQTTECIEIMTGAALPESLDTVIRYEDLHIENGLATLTADPKTIIKGQNVHYKGKDRKQHDIVAKANQLITPASINAAATVGKSTLLVKKLPRVVIISTGDELVNIEQIPLPFQIRSSNSATIQAALHQYCIQADILHIADDMQQTKAELKRCLNQYDVILLSGGISIGKFDYIPAALEELSVKTLFHKVQQRPGKPFWFGTHSRGAIVFAFPGNPVSTFMCLYRYFIPWLQVSLGLVVDAKYAVLNEDLNFAPA